MASPSFSLLLCSYETELWARQVSGCEAGHPRAFFIPGPLLADCDGNLQNDSERHTFKMEESSA